MDHLLVTGATGFVGSSLTRVLHERGYALRCLIRPGATASNLRGLPHERVDGTLEDEGVLRDALRGVDGVVHLAALVSFDKRDRQRMFEINVAGTERLASLARQQGVRRFLHVSSTSAVGYSNSQATLDETAPYNFRRLNIPYSDSKHDAELAIQAQVRRGLDAVIVNPASMFGPGDRRKAAGSLLEAVAYGKLPFCPAGGVCFADVRDVAAGCAAALERGRTGERYILGGQNLTGRELIGKICAVLAQRPPRFAIPRFVALGMARLASFWEIFRPMKPPVTAAVLRSSPRYLWYSSRKAEEELSYASYPIEMAIKAAFDWMLDLDLIDSSRIQALGRV